MRYMHEQNLSASALKGRSHFGASQEVIETADAVPAIPIWLQQHAVAGILLSITVVLGEEVDQGPALCISHAHGKANFLREGAQVVDEDYGVIAPVITHYQDLWIAG